MLQFLKLAYPALGRGFSIWFRIWFLYFVINIWSYCEKLIALLGNWSLASCVKGESSTTEPRNSQRRKWMEIYIIWRAFTFVGLFWQFFYISVKFGWQRLKEWKKTEERNGWNPTWFEEPLLLLVFSGSFFLFLSNLVGKG